MKLMLRPRSGDVPGFFAARFVPVSPEHGGRPRRIYAQSRRIKDPQKLSKPYRLDYRLGILCPGMTSQTSRNPSHSVGLCHLFGRNRPGIPDRRRSRGTQCALPAVASAPW
jgi:hypothetical protein